MTFKFQNHLLEANTLLGSLRMTIIFNLKHHYQKISLSIRRNMEMSLVGLVGFVRLVSLIKANYLIANDADSF